MTLAPFEITLLAGLLLTALELLSGSFVMLGFGLGCFAVATAEYFRGHAAIYSDVLLFAGVALTATIALRASFAHSGDIKHGKGDVNDY